MHASGFLARRGDRFCCNAKTGRALQDHEFTLDDLEVIEKPPTPKKPPAESRQEVTDSLSKSRLQAFFEVADFEAMFELQLEVAREEARIGDPFPLIRLQWPDLVIEDETDKFYFAKHCNRAEHLDLRLDDKQCHFISQIFNRRNKEVAIKGCTSPGKGFATALAINVWYDIWKEDRIILISPTVDHAISIMFAEVSKIRRRMKFPGTSAIFTTSIKDAKCESHLLQILNPEGGEGVSGAHGKNTMYVFDEASRVPGELIDNARSPARMIIAISNPRTLSGWFYDLFPKTNPDIDQEFVDRGIPRAVVTFGGRDCLNVKANRLNDPQYSPPGGINIEAEDGNKHWIPEGVPIPASLQKYVRALIPAQMDAAKYVSLKQSKNKTEVMWRADGQFPSEDAEMQIVPASWLRKPTEEWKKHREEIVVTAFGLDLAYSLDGDSTIFVSGGWKGIKHIFATKKASTGDTLAWIRQMGLQLGIDIFNGEAPIAVDTIGAGGDRFCDLMEEAGCNVIRSTGNASSKIDPHTYMNTRAELYGEFGNRLNPDSDHLDTFMVPDDELMVEEFAAHEKVYASDGIKFYLTPKSPSAKQRSGGVKLQTVKEKIGRSPDRSDAVVLCYAAIRESSEVLSGVLDQFDPSKIATSAEQRGDRTYYTTAAGEETTDEMVVVDIEEEKRLFVEMLNMSVF